MIWNPIVRNTKTPKAAPNPELDQSNVGCSLWNFVTSTVAQIHQPPWRVTIVQKDDRARTFSGILVRSSQYWDYGMASVLPST